MLEIRKPTKELKRILNTRKTKVHVLVKSSHKVLPSYWDGGSRTITYRLDGTSLNPVDSLSSPFDQRKLPEVVLDPQMVLVELGHFCGKEATPMLIVGSEEALKGLVE